MDSKSRPSFQISLEDFLDSHLADAHSRPIPHHIAEIVEILAKDRLLCYVQWPDKYSPHLDGPVLWRYKYWAEDFERTMRARKRSEDERVKRFIFEANVRLVARFCKTQFGQDDNWSSVTAFSLMKKGNMNAIKALGIESLIEREDQL